jgi:competence protein ComEA
MRQIAYVMIGVLVGFILAGSVFLVTRMPAGKPIALEAAPTKAPLEVHVVGAVVRPGVYTLPQGSRVQDAIDAAGGLLAGAQPNTINLAAKLEDGQQVQIGGTGAASPGAQSGSPFSVVPTVGSSQCDPNLIDINNASIGDLETLPGIGQTFAQSIIDYRDQNGPFQQIEDITNVPGIGATRFEAIRDQITVCP